MVSIEKPLDRSALRRWAGKKYFIFKRSINWWKNKSKLSLQKGNDLNEIVFEHRSTMLRPLKDVDMYLQRNKITNLRLAAKKIDGVIVEPGQVFSFWRLVGSTSAKKGYLEGLVLENGKISKGIGGGLCQMGNLLYWVCLHSPLSITERYRHSYDVFPDVNRTIPFACGATLSYNYIDLQITNTSDVPFQFKIWVDETHLNCELRSSEKCENKYRVYETDHQFNQQIWGGYTRHNRIWKEITSLRSGEVRQELISENHALMMYSPLLSE